MAKKIGNRSELDAFLGTYAVPEIGKDEWTSMMACERSAEMGRNITFDAMRTKLLRQERAGVVTSRKVLIDGKWVNVYKLKQT